jgi:hypothetical protein
MKLTIQDFAEVVAALRAPATTSSAQEKRRAVRMSVTAKLEVTLINEDELGRTFSTLTRDISLTGAGLLQSVALQQGQEFVLVLPRPHGKPLCVCAVTLHCRPLADGVFGVGCEYTREAPPAVCDKLINRDEDQQRRIRESVLH